jgi:hypothetical protein
MRKRAFSILYNLLTNDFFIVAGAIVLFLLVNALVAPGKVGPVMPKFLI